MPVLDSTDLTNIENAVWNAARANHPTHSTMGGLLAGFALDSGVTGATGQNSSTTVKLANTASGTTDCYKGCIVVLMSSGGVTNQARIITAYDGATKIATISPAWATIPDTWGYIVIPVPGSADLPALAGTLASIVATLATIQGYVDELETRLTSLRAAALDNLDAAISTRATPAQVTAAVPTANQNADALLDRANGVESLTPRNALKHMAAVLAGKGSGTVADPWCGIGTTTPRVAVTLDGRERTDVTLTP